VSAARGAGSSSTIRTVGFRSIVFAIPPAV
jgi:hypothetical protein